MSGDQSNLSLWQKIKGFLNLKTNSDKSDQQDSTDGEGESGSSGATGAGKLEGTGFIDPKAATIQPQSLDAQYVKDPETVLYNELKKDPAAMQALKDLTNGQIPSSEATSAFEKVRNSEVALETIANSEFAPPDIKSKAREELAHQQRKKLAAQEGFKKPPPKPGF